MTREIEITFCVPVSVDESKFTPEFMEEFRKNFYNFDSIDEHMEHLAQMAARGIINTPCFIEGYGNSEDMGIDVKEAVQL